MELQKKNRPQTPHVEIGQFIHKDNVKENIFKNYSNLMKQIVINQNENFLNGTINIVDYILAKYLNIDVNEVKKIEKISIKINGDYGLLNQFGERLPQLLSLKLNNSFIQSVTDIGTNFKLLRVLQLNNCLLSDLSGLICFESLDIFEAKNNKIEDLFELEMCTSITKLDLENNLLEKEENLDFIGALDKLKWINLTKNRIKNYEARLKELLPSLETIVSNTNNDELIVNQTHSTNDSSPLLGKQTNSDFYKAKIHDEDNVISIDSELKFNKTQRNFIIPKGGLKPVIMKKEEDISIKSLRESLNPTEMKNSFNKKPLEKVLSKKDTLPLPMFIKK